MSINLCLPIFVAFLLTAGEPAMKWADPLFVNPEQGDFTLRSESPALALGFQPIDLSQVGPRVKTGPNP